MPKRSLAVLAWLLAPVLAGCPAGGPDGPGANASGPGGGTGNPFISRPAGSADPARPPQAYLVVRLRLVTVEVPVGMASGSEEIWSYLEEEPVRSIGPAGLGRNGIRVGLGRQDNWQDLARILKRLTGQSPKQNLVVAMPGQPLPIVLKENQAEQTIFLFHDDRTLRGADYPQASDNVLAIVCTLDEDDSSKVLVTMTPQVRSIRAQTRFVVTSEGPRIVAEPEVSSFTQLTCQAMVPSQDFLVIGPGAYSQRPTSLGHHFLVKKKQGMEFETLLVLIPEVFAAPARETP